MESVGTNRLASGKEGSGLAGTRVRSLGWVGLVLYHGSSLNRIEMKGWGF